MRMAPAAALLLAVGAPALAQVQPAAPRLALPIACAIGRTCEVQNYVDRDPGPGARDYRCGGRTYDGHKGVDLRIPDMAAQRRGVDVLAAAPGRVARLRDGEPDISIRAPGAPTVAGKECGNAVVIDHGGGWETQYCHLARGSIRVAVGQTVSTGQPVGQVGLSGATEFPHLHFQVRGQGRIVDPFGSAAGGQCGLAAAAPLWTAAAGKTLAYRAGALLNAGFADAPVEMGGLEEGRVRPPTARSAMLVVYGRAIGLQKGDVLELALAAPDGRVLAQRRLAPLDRDKAQYMAYVGKTRSGAAWPRGLYRAQVRVRRAGRVVLQKDFAARL
ncbi:M23 family metallopeptidase [Phenylobacterium sp.]|uniref:M23 family metallopeptidase n=1 Tax=Phenylobacterium sp. TaxID=1871053 RepID=UPI003918A2D1